MKRVLVALLLGGAIFGTIIGVAATVGVQGGTIQAGVDPTLYCDTDGVQVQGWGLETTDNTVRFVRIGGISTDCQSNDIFVRVEKADGTLIAYSGAVHLDSTNTEPNVLKVNFPSPYPNPGDIDTLKIWIEGPNP
jgi:hypothetical protein